MNSTSMKAPVLSVVAALSLAACTSVGGVNNTADSGSAGGTTAAAKAADKTSKTAKSAKSAGPAKVGQAITIKGNREGAQIKVTAIKVVDPVRSSNEYDTPESGNRYVGVQFRIANTGTVAYNDFPSNGAKVIDASGQQFDSALTIASPTVGAALPSGVKLSSGSSALGYLVFEVPTASKVAKVQFSADSGFGDTAEWVS